MWPLLFLVQLLFLSTTTHSEQRGPELRQHNRKATNRLFVPLSYYEKPDDCGEFWERPSTTPAGPTTTTTETPSPITNKPDYDYDDEGRVRIRRSAGAHVRLYNSQTAYWGQFPSFVALTNLENGTCGTVLLTLQIALTATRCLFPEIATFVQAPWTNIERSQFHFGTEGVFENFDASDAKPLVICGEATLKNFYDDYTIIIINKEIELNQTRRVRPICMPEGPLRENEIIQAVGLGAIDKEDIGYILPERVQFVNLTRVTYNYTNKIIATTPVKRPSKVCRGDWGGPMVVTRKKRQYLYGLISKGPNMRMFDLECNNKDYKLFGTNVYFLKDRIMKALDQCIYWYNTKAAHNNDDGKEDNDQVKTRKGRSKSYLEWMDEDHFFMHLGQG